MNFFLLLNTKEDILKNVGNQLMDPIDFHSKTTNPMEANRLKQQSK